MFLCYKLRWTYVYFPFFFSDQRGKNYFCKSQNLVLRIGHFIITSCILSIFLNLTFQWEIFAPSDMIVRELGVPLIVLSILYLRGYTMLTTVNGRKSIWNGILWLVIPLISDQGPGDRLCICAFWAGHWSRIRSVDSPILLHHVWSVPDSTFESDTHVRVKMCTRSWCHLQMLYLCIFYKNKTVIQCHWFMSFNIFLTVYFSDQ